VMMANITFLSFLLFSMCHSIHVAVNTWLNCSFFTLIPILAGLSVGARRLTVVAKSLETLSFSATNVYNKQ